MSDSGSGCQNITGNFFSGLVLLFERPIKMGDGTLTAYAIPLYVSHTSDPELVRKVLLAAAVRHRDVLEDPAPEVEFVEAGLGALRFQLQVWSTEHLKTAGTLKSDLNFEVWRELAAAGVTVAPTLGTLALGLTLVPPSSR